MPIRRSDLVDPNLVTMSAIVFVTIPATAPRQPA
jgi:hypothetical protein